MFRKKRLSDTEHVEMIRVRISQSHRFRWIWPIGSIVYFIILLVFVDILDELLDSLPGARIGLLFGGIMGIVLGGIAHSFGHGIRQWIDACRGNRTENLLLKYHDELMGNTNSNQNLEPIVTTPVN